MKIFVVLGSVNALMSVVLGAYGAHVLADKSGAAQLLATWHKATTYQMYHALALILIALLVKLWPQVRSIRTAGLLLLLGIILFSGSLYVMVISGWQWLRFATPVGGCSFIAGWALLTFSVRKFDRY